MIHYDARPALTETRAPRLLELAPETRTAPGDFSKLLASVEPSKSLSDDETATEPERIELSLLPPPAAPPATVPAPPPASIPVEAPNGGVLRVSENTAPSQAVVTEPPLEAGSSNDADPTVTHPLDIGEAGSDKAARDANSIVRAAAGADMIIAERAQGTTLEAAPSSPLIAGAPRLWRKQCCVINGATDQYRPRRNDPDSAGASNS